MNVQSFALNFSHVLAWLTVALRMVKVVSHRLQLGLETFYFHAANVEERLLDLR